MRFRTRQMPRQQPDPPRRRSPALWPALLIAVSLPGHTATGEPDVAAAMQEQQALLDQIGSEVESAEASLLEGVEDHGTDPRIAPRTPIPRDLPPGIFDEETVFIPEGQWGRNKRMTLERRVLDADGDGKPEVVRFVDPKSQFMIRQIEDRNYDGVQDTWSDFEWGAVTTRVIDTNDDGNPDTWEVYAEGRMTRREVDRDDDGIRDAFYTYDGDSLTGEEHDANNDGKIDLVVRFQARRRIKSEEDLDHDGRMDKWTFFATPTQSAHELPARIDHDEKRRGFADTFEYFHIANGKAILTRREKDTNGDGKVDIVSIYENGKLVRREIADASLLPEA